MKAVRRALATAAIAATLLVGAPPAAPAATGLGARPVTVPGLFDIVDRAACAAGRTKHEIIRYTAQKQYGLAFYGRVSLTCGDESVGYEHIRVDHGSQWKRKLEKYGGHGAWDDFMSFVVARTLSHPSDVRNYGSGKYCYTTPIQLYQGDKLVNTFHPQVIVSTTTRRVITAIPTSRGC